MYLVGQLSLWLPVKSVKTTCIRGGLGSGPNTALLSFQYFLDTFVIDQSSIQLQCSWIIFYKSASDVFLSGDGTTLDQNWPYTCTVSAHTRQHSWGKTLSSIIQHVPKRTPDQLSALYDNISPLNSEHYTNYIGQQCPKDHHKINKFDSLWSTLRPIFRLVSRTMLQVITTSVIFLLSTPCWPEKWQNVYT